MPSWDAWKAKAFTVSWDSAQLNSKNKNEWVKAGAILPEVINNKYWMLFGDRNLWMASSKDGLIWEADYEPFDRVKFRIETTEANIETIKSKEKESYFFIKILKWLKK